MSALHPPRGFWIGTRSLHPTNGMLGPFATEDDARQALADAEIYVTGVPLPDIDVHAEPAPAPRAQDADRHTCSICGRVGTRRYIPDGDGGWKCSPTATACIGNQPGALTTTPEEPAFDEDNVDDNGGSYAMPDGIPNAERFEPEPGPAAPQPAPAAKPAADGTTARCTGCPRTWNLTGRILTQAIDMHERKHDHIVDIEDGADQ